MKISLIQQLIGFKKYELENLVKDYQTLAGLVRESSQRIEHHEKVIEDYKKECLNSKVSNASEMLNQRQFLHYLVSKQKVLQKDLEIVEEQRDAAFLSYQYVVAEIKLNEKLLGDRVKREQSELVINAYKMSDDLELMRFNDANSQ